MEHLNHEALSRLVDESPTAAEQDHLGACARCTAELEVLRRQTAALGALPDVRPPRGDWEGLEARLLAAGLLAAEPRSFGAPNPLRAPWLRRAAMVALFLGGAAVGAGAARMVPTPGGNPVAQSGPGALVATADPGTALAQMQDAERAYIDALAHYRQLIGAQTDEVASNPRTHYAALEQLVQASQAALSQAPADPFLNGVLASALAEQQAVSRRLAPSAAGQDGWF